MTLFTMTTERHTTREAKSPGIGDNMNKDERMEIVLLLDDATQMVVEVVKLLQQQLTPYDFPFVDDGWEQNMGFRHACRSKLKTIRDATKVAYGKFTQEETAIRFLEGIVEPRDEDTYGYKEEVCVGRKVVGARLSENTEPLMTYGPTALAKARQG